MQIRLPKWKSMMLLGLSFVLFAGCGIGGAEKENAEVPTVMAGASESPEDGIAALPEQPQTAKDHESDETELQSEEHITLEQFGTYLEYMLKEGDWEELEQYVISETLTWDEAAEMADVSPAFAHFSSYGEYWFDSAAVFLLKADINGDGYQDIIEYLPDVGTNANSPYPQQYSLTIYTNDAGQQYSVMYFQPYFAAAVSSYPTQIFVLQYEEETYLVFQIKYPAEEQMIVAYLIRDNTLAGQIALDYERTDVTAEVTCCKNGMEEMAEELCGNAMEYCRDLWGDFLLLGNAEKPILEGQEAYEMLTGIAREEEAEYNSKYRAQSGLDSLFIATIAGAGDLVLQQSDLDNDGKPEWYAKAFGWLGMIDKRWHMFVYPTGELYGGGKHEGERGLKYNMVSQGQRTDFEQLCGLDIWSSDNIPQAFWVEQCGEENITFIKYYDKNYFTCFIEGYCIRDGSYETVLSIRYRPAISCDPQYEWHTVEEGREALSYTVHLPVEKETPYPYPVLYGLRDEKLQNTINQAMAELLQERIDNLLEGMEIPEKTFSQGASCNVLSAKKEQLVLKYVFWGAYALDGTICLEADLVNGDVRIFNYYGSDYDCPDMVEPGW